MPVRMSEQMRERVNEAIRYGDADRVELTGDHVDQAAVCEVIDDLGRVLQAAYTPWGIAAIEAAFLDRVRVAEPWDGKDLIRRDILTNPHLHTSIKERLLKAFEAADWARWYDNFYAKRIMGPDPDKGLADEIRRDPHLTELSRDNLLFNLDRVLGRGPPRDSSFTK